MHHRSNHATIADTDDMAMPPPTVGLKPVETLAQVAIPAASNAGEAVTPPRRCLTHCRLRRLHKWNYHNRYYRTCRYCGQDELRSGFGDSLFAVYGDWERVEAQAEDH